MDVGADLMDMEFMHFIHRHGLAAERARNFGTEGVLAMAGL